MQEVPAIQEASMVQEVPNFRSEFEEFKDPEIEQGLQALKASQECMAFSLKMLYVFCLIVVVLVIELTSGSFLLKQGTCLYPFALFITPSPDNFASNDSIISSVMPEQSPPAKIFENYTVLPPEQAQELIESITFDLSTTENDSPDSLEGLEVPEQVD